jgi:hypothetical protein
MENKHELDNNLEEVKDVKENDFAVWDSPAPSPQDLTLPAVSEASIATIEENKPEEKEEDWPPWDSNEQVTQTNLDVLNARDLAAPVFHETTLVKETSIPPLIDTPAWSNATVEIDTTPKLSTDEMIQTPVYEKPNMLNLDNEKDVSSFTLVNQMSNLSFTTPPVTQPKVLENNLEDNPWGNAWAQ